MDRITRKSLKDDRFAAEVTHSVEFLGAHRRQSLLYGGIGVAVLALVLGVYFYRQHQQTASHDSLAKALETGQLRRDARVMLCGFGGGLSWGAALLDW